MAIEVVSTCPLGSKCEEIKDNKMHRCLWYQCIQGQNPQTGEMIDDWNCAIVWQNILMVESSRATHSVAAATEDFRNQVCERTDITNKILTAAMIPHIVPQEKLLNT